MNEGMEGAKGVAYSRRDKNWVLRGGRRWIARGEAGWRGRQEPGGLHVTLGCQGALERF